ncbi:MAG TPA: hypothetical protein PK858_12590, partial [Saprospiraceae bacterium]|nr:hypothetical protein [Saprospiraceae bacterium]
MRHFASLICLGLLGLLSCSPARRPSLSEPDPLAAVLRAHAAQWDSVLRQPAYEVQILYTRIERDGQGRPT